MCEEMPGSLDLRRVQTIFSRSMEPFANPVNPAFPRTYFSEELSGSWSKERSHTACTIELRLFFDRVQALIIGSISGCERSPRRVKLRFASMHPATSAIEFAVRVSESS